MRLSGSHNAANTYHITSGPLSDHERLIQIAKWVIYGLLFVNFGFYLAKNINAAHYTITDQTTIMGWLAAFADAMDQFAWVMLIFIYEIETWWMDDDYDNKVVLGLMNGFKVLFAAMVVNTIISYSALAFELTQIKQAAPAGGLCSLADQGLAFLRNLAYTTVTSDTCTTIAYSGEIFRYPKDPVVTDMAGLQLDTGYRVLDVVEAATWFAILGFTELSVRLLDRGVYKGQLTEFEKYGKYICYGLMFGISIFWLANGQYLYVWDEFLWIASFLLLELNMIAWRSDLARQDGQDLRAQAA
ncbi:MAG: hypothetical protein AAF607_09390 [Pseudomonadota bacterium]